MKGKVLAVVGIALVCAGSEARASTGQARCVVRNDKVPYQLEVLDVTWFRPVHMNCLQLGDVADRKRLVDEVRPPADTVFVLDGWPAAPEQVMQPGRRIMFWENRHQYKLISGATDNLEKVYGLIRQVEKDSVVLAVYAGDVPPESWVLMSGAGYLVRVPLDRTFAMADKAVFLKDGAPASRDEVLAKGNQVELLPERTRLVVSAWSKPPPLHVELGKSRQVWAVKVRSPKPLTLVKLADNSECTPRFGGFAPGFRLAFGSHIEPVEYEGLVYPRLKAGLHGVLMRDGGAERLIFPSADESIFEGTVRSVDAAKKLLTVAVGDAEQKRDVSVTLGADTEFFLDGRTSAMEQALAVGCLVRVAPPRPPVVEWFSKGNVYVNANVFYLNDTKGQPVPENKPLRKEP